MAEIAKWMSANQALTAALIGLVGVVVGGVLNAIVWPMVSGTLHSLWNRSFLIVSRREFEASYLGYVIGQTERAARVPSILVAASGVNTSQELDNVYIPLNVKKSASSDDYALTKAVLDHDRLLILGHPGTGKTTTVSFLALMLARSRRSRFIIQSSTRRQQDRLARKYIRTTLGFRRSPLPILLSFSRLRSSGTESDPHLSSLMDFVEASLRSNDLLRSMPQHYFADRLRRGECLVLLDGFDELTTPDARNAATRMVNDLAPMAAAKGNRFIVTSRIIGYQQQLQNSNFFEVTLAPMSQTATEELTSKWAKALQSADLAPRLMSQLVGRPQLLQLASNPLMLSLIVLVQFVRNAIPDRRDLLYRECINILLDRRTLPPYTCLSSEEVVQLLRRIAYHLHDNQQREIRRSELEQEVVPNLVDRIEHSALDTDVKQIIASIERNSELLAERGFDAAGEAVMGFSHLTFQEYMVACFYREQIGLRGFSDVANTLLTRYESNPDWWREVCLLFAAQLESSNYQEFMRHLSS